jgi:hypothetical protein
MKNERLGVFENTDPARNDWVVGTSLFVYAALSTRLLFGAPCPPDPNSALADTQDRHMSRLSPRPSSGLSGLIFQATNRIRDGISQIPIKCLKREARSVGRVGEQIPRNPSSNFGSMYAARNGQLSGMR